MDLDETCLVLSDPKKLSVFSLVIAFAFHPTPEILSQILERPLPWVAGIPSALVLQVSYRTRSGPRSSCQPQLPRADDFLYSVFA